MSSGLKFMNNPGSGFQKYGASVAGDLENGNRSGKLLQVKFGRSARLSCARSQRALHGSNYQESETVQSFIRYKPKAKCFAKKLCV